jgi:hypothetical protein
VPLNPDKVYHAVVLEFRPNDPLGVSNTVVELLPRRRREAYARALEQVPAPIDRSSEKLIYEGAEDAAKAAEVLRGVADRVSLQQVQRRNDMETESVYGLAGWLMPSGHQYVPVSVREQV